jgi:DnaK suppressor protein
VVSSDLDARTTERLHAAIQTERRRAHERLTALTREFDAIVEATAEANTDDEHDPEGSTIGFERAQVAALRVQARTHLAELDEAERRLEAGRIGSCEHCGSAIPVERLLARPTARRCVACAD